MVRAAALRSSALSLLGREARTFLARCYGAYSYSQSGSDGQVVLAAGCGEVVAALLRREARECLADRYPEVRHRAGGRAPQQRLQLCEHLLDRVEIRAVGRKEEQPRSCGLDRVLHAGDLVGWQVVHDDDVVGLQHWDQGFGDIAAKARAVPGAVQQRGRAQPARAQGGRDGRGLVVAKRGCKPAALAARRPAIAARHVGGSRGLIQEHQPVRIELGLRLEPRLARHPYVFALLLSCERRALFPGDRVSLEEARQTTHAGLQVLLSQSVAQLA